MVLPATIVVLYVTGLIMDLRAYEGVNVLKGSYVIVLMENVIVHCNMYFQWIWWWKQSILLTLIISEKL